MKQSDLINETDGFNCPGYYGDCESDIEDMKNNRPDVMLMDIELPGISGIEGVKKIKELYPKTDIIMLTVHEDLSLVFQALTAGACGYLDKSASEEKIIESAKKSPDIGAPMCYKIAKLVVSSFQKKPESILTKEIRCSRSGYAKDSHTRKLHINFFISVRN
ncbi:MAG: response regulator transcription factor, partial [Ignavibacteria bacterium]|nr:response regulator transcription factor [Ignavibacteria bacterium]